MNRKQVVTAWILRLVGLSGMLAIVAVVMPLSWMEATHEYLGLGKMPEGPIVEYMARSLSALYAILGFILWHVSFRVDDYLGLVRLLGLVFIVFGLVISWVGVKAGLPMAWTLLEGPPTILAGFWIVLSCRGCCEAGNSGESG